MARWANEENDTQSSCAFACFWSHIVWKRLHVMLTGTMKKAYTAARFKLIHQKVITLFCIIFSTRSSLCVWEWKRLSRRVYARFYAPIIIFNAFSRRSRIRVVVERRSQRAVAICTTKLMEFSLIPEKMSIFSFLIRFFCCILKWWKFVI